MTTGHETGPVRTMRFYSDPNRLYADVGRFFFDGLCRGEAVVGIATALHRRSFEEYLEAEGIDVPGAKATRQILLLDADECLARFMVGGLDQGMPSADPFRELVEDLLAGTQGFPRVRAFGEMTGLLFERGNEAASARLQALWNEVAVSRQIEIYTAYRAGEGASRSLVFEQRH
jgi:hypothetical protein